MKCGFRPNGEIGEEGPRYIVYGGNEMNTNDYTIRLEKEEDYRTVENLVRESFWNVYRPGCSEHIFREEEREMVPYCEEENIALTPYSALASGRFSRKPGENDTKRAAEDAFAKFKYDATADQDNVIISRVAELSEKCGVTMTELSLAWLLTKVTAPIVGATKLHHIEGAVKAVDMELKDSEIAYLERTLCSASVGRCYGTEQKDES